MVRFILFLPRFYAPFHVSATEEVAEEIIFGLHFLRGLDNSLGAKIFESIINFHKN